MTRALVHARFRPFLEADVPEGAELVWYEDADQFRDTVSTCPVVWPDVTIKAAAREGLAKAIGAGSGLAWCSVMSSGVDWLPLDRLARGGIALTNGAGLHAHSVAEFAVLGMLSLNKKWRTILRAQDRGEWLVQPPGREELLDARVLVIGAGEIGQRLRAILEAFDAKVTLARRTAQGSDLGEDQWRAVLGEFDWVVLVVPSTLETRSMFGAEELAAMKPGAGLVNIARGNVVVQEALVAALSSGHLGKAYLDVTDPEPLPEGHPLWGFDNVEISMHCAGLAQDSLLRRAAARFAGNLARFIAGEPLMHQVDYARGY
ncbi:D-2-hydroxyacid dehydrogenase [Novosphingobium profundi]|uniref:D-2-hydroxyacid dehydrogenase n=1 Tax=Novosphingobium profundi TaxID=1774954 RepID=UPI001BD9986E|nr:D-2-hydroxyacid dehydrogenase [Novosphingobium profundi]